MTIPVIGIGASAGGLDACKTLFQSMPANTGSAFVIISHLNPEHKSLMSEILAKYTEMPVIQVQHPTPLCRDHVYLLSPKTYLMLEQDTLVPHEFLGTPDIPLPMPIDRFFQSLAVEQQERAIAIVLSGTMNDGSLGIQSVKAHGGLVAAQAPETAQHDNMPRNAIDTGLVDFVLPVEEMPDIIVNYLRHPSLTGGEVLHDLDAVHRILLAIQTNTGYDFRGYKRTTLIRRIERRMGLRHLQNMAEYVSLVQQDQYELDALWNDLLIGVTGFFRELTAWERLKHEVMSSLSRNVSPDRPIRVWIPGCSSGEEAYTMAMILREACETANTPCYAQIFATDIDEAALSRARTGLYPDTIEANISAERLQRFFTREHQQFRIAKVLRENVVFAVQNVISDAPFSNMDIISCRNLLIYLEPEIQHNILRLFHFGLREGGYLMLGSSETVGTHQEHFSVIDKEARLYRCRGRKQFERTPLPSRRVQPWIPLEGRKSRRISRSGDLAQVMRGHLVKHFAPAAILINATYDILQFSGPTDGYLNLPQGDPALDVVSLAKEGLRVKLRTALYRVVKNHETVGPIRTKILRAGCGVPVRMTICPLDHDDAPEPLFVITFQDDGPLDDAVPDAEAVASALHNEVNDTLVRQLEAELTETRDDLQHTIEALESSNEELRASNEEMMSMNEELQTSNEELETSKEELQSLNEELNTVNTELRENVKEVEAAKNDLQNLMNSTEIATVFLDTQYALRRFTPAAQRVFTLGPADVGCPLVKFAHRFGGDHITDDVHSVMDTLTPITREVLIAEGGWYLRRILPFRTNDHRIEGLVLTFTDITVRKQAEEDLRASEKRFRLLADTVPVLINAVGSDGTFVFWNTECERATGYSAEEILGNPEATAKLYPNTAYLQHIMHEWARKGSAYRNWEIALTNKDGEERIISWSSVADEAPIPGWTSWSVGVDITERKRAEERLAQSEAFLHTIYDQAEVGIMVIDVNGDDYVYAGINSAYEAWLNISAEWVIGKTPNNLAQHVGQKMVDTLYAIYREGHKKRRTVQQEYCLKRQDMTSWWTMTLKPLLNEQEQVYRLICTALNITDRKQAEEQITTALAEKETLLQELYHRTKNNMQVVLSMLNLQAVRSQNADVQRIMRETGHKIQAMALVHQKLYQAQNLSQIRLDEYIRELAALLMQGYAISPDCIALQITGDAVSVLFDTAIPCGLILNELMSNALKHAFPAGQSGELRISLTQTERGDIELIFSDNGVGLPAGADVRAHANLGLGTIISIIEQQLRGTIDFTNSNGVTCRIRFTDTRYAARV